MKKLLGLILLCALSLNVHSQESLTFKGIPIDGDLNTFVEKLKEIGFTQLYLGDNSAMIEGDFTGKQCKVMINASESTNLVYSVGVIIEEANNWNTLNRVYNEYKKLLSTKYGEGKSREYFTYPFDKNSEGMEMTALHSDRCTYATFFELPQGRIVLAIMDLLNGAVTINYTNKTNEQVANTEDNAIKSNDL